MVDSVKSYNIAGIGANVQLGKEVNAQIITNSDHIALKDRDNALNRAAVADGTHQQHAVTKAQLDAVNINRVYSNIVTYSDGVTNMFVIPANTTVLSVSVESIGNWLNTGANTNITIGDAADPDRLFAEFDPTVATKDETNYRYDQQTTIRSTVTADGATAGVAKILILYAATNLVDLQTSRKLAWRVCNSPQDLI